MTIDVRVGCATPLPRHYGGWRGSLPAPPAPRRRACRASCKSGERSLTTRHLPALRDEGRRVKLDEGSLVPAFLINGTAIRIAANSLKTITRHPVRSTVEGGSGRQWF